MFYVMSFFLGLFLISRWIAVLFVFFGFLVSGVVEIVRWWFDGYNVSLIGFVFRGGRREGVEYGGIRVRGEALSCVFVKC